jgi:hypothetical protein
MKNEENTGAGAKSTRWRSVARHILAVAAAVAMVLGIAVAVGRVVGDAVL